MTTMSHGDVAKRQVSTASSRGSDSNNEARDEPLDLEPTKEAIVLPILKSRLDKLNVNR